MNLQVIASPDGDIVWVSGALPGAVHDLTATRIWGIIAELPPAAWSCWATRARSVRTPSARCSGAGTSPPRRRRPTGLMPGCAAPANVPMLSSGSGVSYANSAAAPGAPGSSPKRFTSFKPAKSQDEKAHWIDASHLT